MASLRRRKAAQRLLVALALLLMIAVGLLILIKLSPAEYAGSSHPPSPSGQAVFGENLKNDQKSLDRGVLAYTKVAALNAGAQSTLTVLITDIGKRPRAISLPPDLSNSGWVINNQDVPTGGIISVTATCDNLKCKPETPARQAVLTASKAGYWTWELTTLSPGTARITLAVTTYEENSQIVLNEAAPIEITIPVHATTSYQGKALARTVGGLLRWIGPALLITAAAAIWGRHRKHRRNAPTNAPPDPPQDTATLATKPSTTTTPENSVQPRSPPT